MKMRQIKNFILDILFPKFCLGCRKEGSYLCQDCQSILDISGFHQTYRTGNLDDLYFASDYKNPLIKSLIRKFKFEPLAREISQDLSEMLINHLKQLDFNPPFLKNPEKFFLIPVPLEKKKLKWRGFNQSLEIAKDLSIFLDIPVLDNVLYKIKETPAQTSLPAESRKSNLKKAFAAANEKLIENKNILLVDDVYTTGATMEEAGRILKKAGAKEVIGLAIARAGINEDRD